MGRQSQPGMNDSADKEIHRPEGRDPYPAPLKGERMADNAADDTEDPADLDSEAPHDRGTTRDGNWYSGIDDAEAQLADEGEKKAWKKGLTQNDPPKPQNTGPRNTGSKQH